MASVVEIILKKDDGTEEKVSLDRVTKLQKKLQKARGSNPNQARIEKLYRNVVAYYYSKSPDDVTEEDMERYDYDSADWTPIGCLLECLDEYCGIGYYAREIGDITEDRILDDSEFDKIIFAIKRYKKNCKAISKKLKRKDFTDMYEAQLECIKDAEKIFKRLINEKPDFECHDCPNTGEGNPFFWAYKRWLKR